MKISQELYDHFDQLGKALLTPGGQEIVDDRPMFVPGHIRPLTITEQIQRLMRVELSRQAAAQEQETFEEADDLEPDDDPDDLSNYQKMDMDPGIAGLGRRTDVEEEPTKADPSIEIDQADDEVQSKPEVAEVKKPTRGGIRKNPPAEAATR